MKAELLVEQAGPLTTIQDGGRRGLMRFGVPYSGPVDRLAFAAANRALSNVAGAPAIEVSLGGLTLHCQAGQIDYALCGGDFAAERDGVVIGDWTVSKLDAGSRLRVRPGRVGNWAYLAFAGHLNSRPWLGSVSTHVLAGLGGGILKAGQAVTVDVAPRPTDAGPLARPAGADPIETARIVLGPQDRFFTPEQIDALTGVPFRATGRIDRMGLVLEGPPLIPTALDMLSEPAVRGSVQVNGAGEATLLLADHQTTGGYPKIAVVIGPDVDRLAQLRPGAPIRFVAVSPQEAVAAARAEHQDSKNYLQGLTQPRQSLAERLGQANLVDGVIDACSR